MTRVTTLSGYLARRGFRDSERAATIISRLTSGEPVDTDVVAGSLLEHVLAAADPDLALAGIDTLDGAGTLARVQEDDGWTRRVVALLGGSSALAAHLGRYPDDVDLIQDAPARQPAAALRDRLLHAVGADPASPTPVATETSGDELRLAYRRALLPIAARDLTSVEPEAIVDDVGAELADLADAAMEAALAIARAQTSGWQRTRLSIIGLGKCGAQELNYISDVDVLFVAEPAEDASGRAAASPDEAVTLATKLAGIVSRVCSANTAGGTLWQVDAGLRPEGKAGPLVRTLASHRAYYERWAKNWEFQAMLKARPMAGDPAIGQAFLAIVDPLVWQVSERDGFLPETQAMRRRVVELIPAKERAREIKLSAGGLRDVEFSVQLLQLVHGRTDERLRLRATLQSLRALVSYGYVGRRDGAALEQAYRFQRTLENRVQLFKLRRTHLMPDDEEGLRRLGRGLGIRDPGEVLEQWRASGRKVQRLQQRVFYSPLLEAVARIPSDELRLSTDAAVTRLRALGYADPRAALRHIEALSTGLTRQAEIRRQLLPAMLGWFAEGPNPDHGLLAFRQVSDALGRSPWYLRALRDEGAMAERMARILSSSRYAVDLLMRAPETVQLLADEAELTPRTRSELDAEMLAALRRHEGSDGALTAVRAIRRRELTRIAVGNLLDVTALGQVGEGLSDLASATVEAALRIAQRTVRDADRAPRLAVIALGRWGGRELSYSSDADCMFVVEDADDPQTTNRTATATVSALRSMLHRPGPDPALDLDADLRPEGKGGPLVRSLSSCIAYYGRWSSTWEAQALLRAAPGAGDAGLAAELFAVLDPVRYPDGGLTPAQLAEIRKLKARMEGERLPRGADPSRHTKLGPGGLSDVEWTVQLLQLQHAAAVPGLRTTTTLGALRAAVEAQVVSAEDADVLTEAWTLASKLRNLIMLVRGRPSDSLPNDARELDAVASLLGYHKAESSLLVQDYRRIARHARVVVDRLFWDA